MKKLVSLLLMVVLGISLCACNAPENPYEKYDDLFKMLEREDYSAAMDYIRQLENGGNEVYYDASGRPIYTQSDSENSGKSGSDDTHYFHEWEDATCTEPMTCRVCGATEGSAEGHYYNVSGVCQNCGSQAEGVDEVIEFCDPFMENYVKQALGIAGTEKVTRFAMSQLYSVTVGDGVADAQDLRHAVNLSEISIEADNVQNLSVLCDLPITFVGFGFQNCIDISFMENMKQVEYIYFNASVIVGGELSYLVASPNLKDLFFYSPDGSGIEFLEGAPVERLQLWHAFDFEDDVSVLKTLPNLKELEILTYQGTSDAQRAVYTELMAKGVAIRFL